MNGHKKRYQPKGRGVKHGVGWSGRRASYGFSAIGNLKDAFPCARPPSLISMLAKSRHQAFNTRPGAETKLAIYILNRLFDPGETFVN